MLLYQTYAFKLSAFLKAGNRTIIYRLRDLTLDMYQEKRESPLSKEERLTMEYYFHGLIMAFDYWYNHVSDMTIEEFLAILGNIRKI
ncbi:Uncharacterised protein [Streptococcus gallolyticus]|uniref:Transcriptional regulator TetR C-terminal Firmicutes type domain-containing protein n=1 Tax=Streptococcus gallolyticus TaxID=315405 RepID=A0AA94M0R0_9STRE|nr:hypothetical protein [Streptococcus gallolyticus]AQP41296.1 hypothetical protein BTR42_01485 [Streptococcus gallolyticus subsp. gallolyticus DSM 16831]SQG78576.1 Uncharacterised protein [Streptococcus gallolyticus]